MTIEIKQGGTFDLDCTLEFDGSSVDITNWDITADVKNEYDKLIENTNVSITDAPNGKFNISVPDTSNWSDIAHKTDIRYEFNGSILYSETIDINVIDSVTES